MQFPVSRRNAFRLSARAALILIVLSQVLLLACSSSEPDIFPTPESTSAAESGGDGAGSSANASDERAGITEDRILLGQSAAFEGPASELGLGMRIGIRTALSEINDQGGVHGRLFELESINDGYEPEAAIANTTYLIEELGVFALVGAVGTPTSRSAAPIAVERGVPYIGAFTGAELLRGAELDYIINIRASYYQETEEMVNRLTTDLGIERIAVIYQDDSFGRAGYQGARNALLRRDMEPVAIGVYPRNTTAIKTALLTIQQAEAEAVIVIGAYAPVAELILWARHVGIAPRFVTTSFVGSNALANELGGLGEGVFVTQVVPFPTDDSVPIVAEYLAAMQKYAPGETPGFVSLEGYIAGRLVIEATEMCGRNLSRSCFIQTLQTTDVIELSGFELIFAPDDNQGSDRVFLTVIGGDGKLHATETMNLQMP